MKIGIAQTRPIPGDLPGNLAAHKKLADRAVARGADTLVFPELSLTGYEPTLAHALAMEPDDSRLDELQTLSNAHRLTLGVGVPLKTTRGISISMLILQPDQPSQVYAKKYLHSDEEAYFVSGKSTLSTLGKGTLALAICYELSVDEHAEEASKNGAKIYLASVAKTERGVDKAWERLSTVAKDYALMVLVANCVGPCDGEEGGGKSAIWDKSGTLLAQLNDTDEGILILDTSTGRVKRISI